MAFTKFTIEKHEKGKQFYRVTFYGNYNGLYETRIEVVCSQEVLRDVFRQLKGFFRMSLEFQEWSAWEKIEGDYWWTTYPDLNPFMSPINCRSCGERPVEKRWRDARDAPVTEFEFRCQCGHTFGTTKTYD